MEMKDQIGPLVVVHVGMVGLDADEGDGGEDQGMGKRDLWRWDPNALSEKQWTAEILEPDCQGY